MEREKFEESWKDAFQSAGITPSDRVWVNIELELEKAKGGDLKRRLLFYQMLAAASVVLAMAIGGFAYYYNFGSNSPSATSLALDKPALPAPDEANASSAGHSTFDNDSDGKTGDPVNAENEAHRRDQKGRQGVSTPLVVAHAAPIAERNANIGNEDFSSDGKRSLIDNGETRLPLTVNNRHATQLYTPRKIAIDMRPQSEEAEVDPVVAMLARLDRREQEMRGDDNQRDKTNHSNLSEKLWTSIGFAAGSFNTVQPAVAGSAPQPTALAMNAGPIVDQETQASGYAYSMGLNVGTKLSDRWVLQGGVNYLTNTSDYTASNVVVTSVGPQQQRFRAATAHEVINKEAEDLNDKILFSAPYNVNNSMRYLSIPMQAGYLLVDKTVGVQLNAGVATDVFLQNTVTPDSDNLDKTTQPGGADSPYRTFNLSGLFGTEVSYRIGDHYRLSVNPGLRYPFSTIYKSELGVQASPLTFDVGLRFRYIFH